MPPAPKRILYFVGLDTYFVSHRLALAQEAQKRGYEVHVMTNNGDRRELIERAGIVLHPLSLRRSSLNPFRELWTLVHVIAIVRRVRPALIHNVAAKPAIYGSLAALFSGRPGVVNLLAGMGYIYSNKSKRGAVARVVVNSLLRLTFALTESHVVVQNEEDAKTVRRARLVSKGRLSLIRGSGVDTHRYTPGEPAARVPVFALPARLLRAKGVEDFVEAGRRVQGMGVLARFALIGSPDHDNRDSLTIGELERWVSERSVEWWGWQDDMVTVLRTVDVVCLPSRYREGVPKSLIDGASMGLPLISTDTPGCRDISVNGVNGINVAPGDIDGLVDAITRLAVDPDLRRRMGIASRRIAIDTFSQEIVHRATFSIYDKALKAVRTDS